MVFLNLIGNLSQLSVTILFGIIGLIFLWNKIEFPFSKSQISLGFGSICLFFAAFLFFRKRKIGRKISSFKSLNTDDKLKLMGLSTLRYLLFSHQFYLFLLFFGTEIDYLSGISAISLIYLFASVLPSIFILEAVVKGSIALWIFSFFQVEEIEVLTTVGFMWLFNFAIPALLGSYFVMKFKLQKISMA